MKNFMNTRKFTAVAGLLVTALLTGCGYNHDENFAGDTAPTSVGKFAQAQSAAGAKEDGMLYDMHFHGSELTSLGQGKLDLIAKGTVTGDSVTVYLNMSHDLAVDRQAAVADYLKNKGFAAGKIIVADGTNPNLTSPSSYQLHKLYKHEGGTYDGEAAEDAPSAGSSLGAAGAGH